MRLDFGITPAYAGKSRPLGWKHLLAEDHPRLRGEKSFKAAVRSPDKGSPPLTRGKEHVDHVFEHVFGITPAYAGKSFFGRKEERLIKDHPRLRGEKPSL